MQSFDYRIDRILAVGGYWSQRAAHQLRYLLHMQQNGFGSFERDLETAVSRIEEGMRCHGSIWQEDVDEMERLLMPVSMQAKRLTLILCAHAHIDMNWKWSYQETVAITLETFRTMLRLMDRFPEFTFSQSQASTYRIVEKHEPEMLEQIRRRVQEGRWEVTASTWVEADKNMTSGESMARHLLYTRKYLKQLFDLEDDHFLLDFEPDTFGHSQNVPEILAQAGVKYYYHCRGDEGNYLSRWVAPSGRSVLTYLEPKGYQGLIGYEMCDFVPEFCSRLSVDTAMKVYGVGDHGGGPTRRDISRILDMASWPIFPTIRMGRYRDFFSRVENAENIPVQDMERNFVFTGCYTSQSRIKMANRLSEAAAFDAEAIASAAAWQTEFCYPFPIFEECWRDTLFSQFHDILPGSGVTETREYAMGQFQNIMADWNTRQMAAMRAIAAKVNTSDYLLDNSANDMSEGAGVGYGLDHYYLPQTERSSGLSRIYHLFNTAPFAREETVTLTLWDWDGDLSRIAVSDAEGNACACQIVETKKQFYWRHEFVTLLIHTTVPAMGHTLLHLYEKRDTAAGSVLKMDCRTQQPYTYVLENEKIRAEFDETTGEILSLTDKTTGEVLSDSQHPSGIFRLIQEDTSRGMTAWITGPYQEVTDSPGTATIRWGIRGPVRNSLRIHRVLPKAVIDVEVSLDAGSSMLRYEVQCCWEYIGSAEQIPQLAFLCNAAYPCSQYLYDTAMGSIRRAPMKLDVPTLSFGAALSDNRKSALTVITDNKYGMRGNENALQVSLLRSSTNPDTHPEVGMHRMILLCWFR
jgi:alpha-mannosidase